MHKICNIDIRRSGEIFERIERYKEIVVRKLRPEKIILFGSLARGDFNEGSDVDILVIADWKEDFLDRIGVLLKLNTVHLPLEPVGYTREELERMKAEGNPFILKMLEEGKVIYSVA